jgi:hypothetical protein
MILKRFFDDKSFAKLKSEFAFLIDIIKEENSPFKITLGNNNFAIFCYGISIGKVEFSIFGAYEVMIPKVFFPESLEQDKNFNFRQSRHGFFAELSSDQIKDFLSPQRLKVFDDKLKVFLEKPELDFAFRLRQVNSQRDDFIFIDRMVTDGELKGKRMDSLALVKEGESYAIHICEFRLAENENLKELLPRQLQGFVTNIKRYMQDYKTNYITNYQQQRELGLWPEHFPEDVRIKENVKGHIFITENDQIKAALKKDFPDLLVTNVSAGFSF